MKKVREGLYIGNITDAAAVLSAAEEEEERPSSSPTAAVTHILSLVSQEVDPLDFKRPASRDPRVAAPSSSSSSPNNNCKLKQKTVPLLDIHSQNLLDHLEDCLDFIESGRNNGGVVLVHCFAGVSRSGAVVTAYLMKKEHLTMDNALESLKKSSEIVCPNDGFKQQLRMFEEMGCTVNRVSSVYKNFRLATMGDAYLRGERIDSSSYAADPGNVTNKPNSQDSGDQQAVIDRPSKVYRCKKCRRVVASEENVITHIPGAGVTSFKWRKRGVQVSGKDELVQPECTSIFVQPMQWMTPVQEGLVESKLQCIKCEARLGNFNWAGMQCSCGAWVNPAFQLHKGRIDAATL
ncbi:unnamed protein product [Sphagnum troendelagicum]|uniref:protein-tyrosine-phosphatase n=1 Tax=Sphagnum troendelagicum TaxID=128251 RepID=A0ABP0V4D6_9BRYO